MISHFLPLKSHFYKRTLCHNTVYVCVQMAGTGFYDKLVEARRGACTLNKRGQCVPLLFIRHRHAASIISMNRCVDCVSEMLILLRLENASFVFSLGFCRCEKGYIRIWSLPWRRKQYWGTPKMPFSGTSNRSVRKSYF